MKKLAILAALSMVSVSAMADATITLNNYTPDRPIYSQSVGTIAAGNVFVELLGNGQVVKNTDGKSLLSAVDGYFDEGVGVVPGAADNSTVNFVLRAWTGGTSYDTATGSRGQVEWSQATGAWNPAALPPSPATGPDLNAPSSVVLGPVPEPSTIALGMLGAAALLLRRRK